MDELALYCALAFVCGFAISQGLSRALASGLRHKLHERERSLKARLAQLRCLRAAQRISEGAWSHVATELPCCIERRALLQRLSALLPELSVPQDARASLLGNARQAALAAAADEIAGLVKALGEPRLLQLWAQCSYESLHAMLAELVKLPPAANASEFGSVDFLQDLDAMDSIRSDFGDMEIIESYPRAGART